MKDACRYPCEEVRLSSPTSPRLPCVYAPLLYVYPFTGLRIQRHIPVLRVQTHRLRELQLRRRPRGARAPRGARGGGESLLISVCIYIRAMRMTSSLFIHRSRTSRRRGAPRRRAAAVAAARGPPRGPPPRLERPSAKPPSRSLGAKNARELHRDRSPDPAKADTTTATRTRG